MTVANGTMTAPNDNDQDKDRHKGRRVTHLPARHYDALKELADQGNRPFTWELRAAVEEYLAKRGVVIDNADDDD